MLWIYYIFLHVTRCYLLLIHFALSGTCKIINFREPFTCCKTYLFKTCTILTMKLHFEIYPAIASMARTRYILLVILLLCRDIENNLFSGPIPPKLLSIPNFRWDMFCFVVLFICHTTIFQALVLVCVTVWEITIDLELCTINLLF